MPFTISFPVLLNLGVQNAPLPFPSRVLTAAKDQKRRTERVAQRATLFRTLNADLNDKLSFADFVKQMRGDVAADAANQQDHPFQLLTDEELSTENWVRNVHVLEWLRQTRLHCHCAWLSIACVFTKDVSLCTCTGEHYVRTRPIR